MDQRVIGGRYRLLDKLGAGAMGVVWRAQDELIGRQVAVKEMPVPAGTAREQDEFRQRVLREARNAGQLNGPSVITVHDVVTDDRAAYVVMELIDAPTLADLLESGPLPADQVVAIGLQLLDALD